MKVVAHLTDERSISWRLVVDEICGAEVQRRPHGIPWEFAECFPVNNETWPSDIDYRAKLAELVARMKKNKREANKIAKRARRARKARRQVERWQERVRLEKHPESMREPAEASRINGALSTVGDVFNAALQTEDAWRGVWSDETPAKDRP